MQKHNTTTPRSESLIRLQPIKQAKAFDTEPTENPLLHSTERFVSYVSNLDSYLGVAFRDQKKTVKRREIELSYELESLREQYEQSNKKFKQMERQFFQNCESVLKQDIHKWEDHSQFNSDMMQQYQQRIRAQKKLNDLRREKIRILKQELKSSRKEEIESSVSSYLQGKYPPKQKLPISPQKPRKYSPRSRRIKTEVSQLKEISTEQIIKSRSIRKKRQHENALKTEVLIDESKILPTKNQKLEVFQRAKTQTSLPTLRKYNVSGKKRKVDSINCESTDSFNFMRPIGKSKLSQPLKSSVKQMLAIFRHAKSIYDNSVKSEEHWFEKVFFNQRNFDKIVGFLQEADDLRKSPAKPKSKEIDRVSELVPRNFFRLKTDKAEPGLRTKRESTQNSKKQLEMNGRKGRQLKDAAHKKTELDTKG